MTDLNVTLTDPETGEVFDRFSVHRGISFSMISLIGRIHDSIRSEMDIGDFVAQKKKELLRWEILGSVLSRIAVPGGWLYKATSIGALVFVPDPEWSRKPRNSRALMDDGEYPLGSNV